MGEGGVIRFGIAESFKRWHLYVIQFLRVVGAISAVLDRYAQAGEEFLGMFNACDRITAGSSFRVVDFRQALDLLDVEHGIALHVGDFALNIFADLFVALGAGLWRWHRPRASLSRPCGRAHSIRRPGGRSSRSARQSSGLERTSKGIGH